MTLPRAIERYYTAELFRLIQAELLKKHIEIETVEQLQGMMMGMIYMVQIGAITTMFLKEEKLCTYSELVRDGKYLWFTFNTETQLLKAPKILLTLWHFLLAWDALKLELKNRWFDLKYKFVK